MPYSSDSQNSPSYYGGDDPNATGPKAKAVKDVQAGHASGASAVGDAKIKDDYLGDPLPDTANL